MDRVLRILPEIYTHAGTNDFLKTTLHLLRELIEGDHLGWVILEHTAGLRLTKIVTDPHLAPLFCRFGDVWNDAMLSHPYGNYFRPDRNVTTMMLSDVPKRQVVEHRRRFAELYRALEFNYQLTLPLISPDGSIAAFSVDRETKAFTERDRSVLNVLLPHMRRAYANAQQLERGADPVQLRRACEDGFGLTAQEATIAFWIAQGKTNWEIAAVLGSAQRTVEKHVEHVLEKIGVENRVAAALEIHRWSRARSAFALRSTHDTHHAGSILIEGA